MRQPSLMARSKRVPQGTRSRLALFGPAVLLGALVLVAGAGATAGDLDLSFGAGGKVLTNLDGVSADNATAVAIQSNGRVVAAGHAGTDHERFALVRYRSNGSLDPSFGEGGKVVTVIDGNGQAAAVAIQPDGRIVAAGGTDGPPGHSHSFVLVRYDRDGALDQSFGEGGKVFTELGGSEEAANAIAIQPDGKIIAAGYSVSWDRDYEVYFALVRYNPDGTLDQSFGEGGHVLTEVEGYTGVGAVAIDGAGRIVATGSGEDGDFILARYTADGALDPSFGDGGLVRTDVGRGPYAYGAAGITIEPDGKIVAAGGSGGFQSGDFVLARYNPDGSLDPGFGNAGTVLTDLGRDDSAAAVGIQRGGKIVAVGRSASSAGGGYVSDLAVVRFNADGSLDEGFGAGGTVLTNFDGYGHGAALAVLPNRKLIAAGGGGGGSDFALARYQADGDLDAGFGESGKVLTNIGVSADEASAIAIEPGGAIVAAGSSRQIGGAYSGVLAFARYHADGRLDTSFGNGGKVLTEFYGGPVAVAVQTNRRIIATGGQGDFLLVRYKSNGSLDPSFGDGGTVRTDLGGYADHAGAVAIQLDGRIVAAGQRCCDSHRDFALARYNPDGSLDQSFGDGGKVLTDLGGSEEVVAIAIQASGKIVALGQSRDSHCPCPSRFALARYNPDGSLDPSFGEGGTVLTDIDASTSDAAAALALQPGGKIVAAGTSRQTSGDHESNFALVRYNADGSLDQTFGTGGITLTDLRSDDRAAGVAIQPTGKIIAAGNSRGDGVDADFALVRYNPNGSLDQAFGDGGKVLTDIGNSSYDWAAAVAIQSSAKIVVAGGSQSEDGPFVEDFALVRYVAR